MIQAMKNDYPISLLCEVIAVARSGYYAWAAGRRSVREQRDAALRPKLRAAFEQTRHSYGYPRMTVELRAQNQRVGKTRVARLMKEEGLSGRPKRGYRPQTTQSEHNNPIAPNHLANVEKITACDQVWQTDITYLPTETDWLYLAVVIDGYSKRVIGWAFSASLATQLVISALQMAIKRRGGRCAPGLLLHSDRGVQYTSERFRRELAAHGITASMSRRANCYDNARAESFFSTLKIEHTYRHRFANQDKARQSTFEWIEGFYNKRRRHSSIGNISPVDFENQTN